MKDDRGFGLEFCSVLFMSAMVMSELWIKAV